MEARSSGGRRVAVLISGSGTNLQALLDAVARGVLDAEIVCVASSRPGAVGLERAGRAGVPAVVVAPAAGEQRSDYDTRLADAIEGFGPDYVVLAGFMRLLSMAFLSRFPERVVNLHPALPGEFPGTHAIERAYDEARAGARDHTGVMVHFVPDEGIDDGPVLATAIVPIRPDDSLEALEARVHATEHRLLVDTVASLVSKEIPV